jgi:uncharacterized protein YbcI
MPDNREKIMKKLKEIENEIIEIGWQGIVAKYHPDINIQDPNAVSLFRLYRNVYDYIKKQLAISGPKIKDAL